MIWFLVGVVLGLLIWRYVLFDIFQYIIDEFL